MPWSVEEEERGSEGGLNGGNGDRGGATLDPCPRAVIGCEPTR